MKKQFYFFGLILLATITRAQVGINTDNPKSTLDINGDLTIRTVANVETINPDHSFLIRDNSVAGDGAIKEVSSNYLSQRNTAYYATRTGNWSLLNLNLGGGWQKLSLTGTSDTKLGNPAIFNNGVYTATKPGIYMVNYEIQFESGVNVELLGGKKLGLLKNNSLWEEKSFDGVRLAILFLEIASIPVTSSSIQSIVELNTGDSLTFALNANGLLDLGLLTNAKVNLYVYRISH